MDNYIYGGDFTKDDILELKKQFYHIRNKGWIKSERAGTTGIGYTFEKLINKNEENFPVPDYGSIEIKTIRKYSKGKIHLFNSTPDGDSLFPIKRILNIMGYPDKTHPTFNVFNASFSAHEFTNIGHHKRGKLFIDYEHEKIYLVGIDDNFNDLNLNLSWSFDLLKDKLNTKLRYLAIIKADSKFILSDEYFYYKQILFYRLKDFDTFISLINSGDILITFKIGVFKSGKRFGQIHDRGTDFSINVNNLDKLYDLIS